MPVNISITKRMAINLPLSLAADVERLARQDRRSVASWLRNAIEDRVISELRNQKNNNPYMTDHYIEMN